MNNIQIRDIAMTEKQLEEAALTTRKVNTTRVSARWSKNEIRQRGIGQGQDPS